MAAAGAPVRAPVAVALRVLGLSGQAYYPWLKDPVSPRDGDDADVTDVLYDLHADDGTLGYIWAVKDVWSNKIVGYSIDIRMKSSLARAAMRNAIALRSLNRPDFRSVLQARMELDEQEVLAGDA